MNIEISEMKKHSLQASCKLHKISQILQNLEQSNLSSLQQEENEGLQISSKTHQMADNEIFDKCKNKLHQALCEIDSFHALLDGLQKPLAYNQVEH